MINERQIAEAESALRECIAMHGAKLHTYIMAMDQWAFRRALYAADSAASMEEASRRAMEFSTIEPPPVLDSATQAWVDTYVKGVIYK